MFILRCLQYETFCTVSTGLARMFLVPDVLCKSLLFNRHFSFSGLFEIKGERERHVTSRKSIFRLEFSSLFFFIIFRFWRGLYARFDNDIHPRESIADHVCALNDQNESLQDHIRLLSKVFSYDHFDTNQLNHV